MVHMVRFHWRRDINKKAKIMVCPLLAMLIHDLNALQRKVKFPFELDAMDMVTDDLKRKLANANGKIKEIERERAERRKVRKKTKVLGDSLASGSVNPPRPSTAGEAPSDDVPMTDADASKGKEKAKEPTAGNLEDEDVLRDRENKEFEATIDPELRADTGACITALFELCGMCLLSNYTRGYAQHSPLMICLGIVTHKGASADSGHYIGFVKKDVFHPPKSYLEEDIQDCKFATHTYPTVYLSVFLMQGINSTTRRSQ